MTSHFDTEKEQATLAQIREREEEEAVRLLSDKYGVQYVDLSGTLVAPDALRLIKEEDARLAQAVAFAHAAKKLSVAVHNLSNPEYARVKKMLEDDAFVITEYMVSKRSIDHALEQYRDISTAVESRPGVLAIRPTTETELASPSRATLADAITNALASPALDHLSHVLELIFAGAFALRASDIHLEAEETHAILRMRMDGLLTEICSFDPKAYHQLNSRIKVLSGVKINVTNRAQDGRFSIVRPSAQIEIRSSFIPGNFGESVVMRILDPKATMASYTELGIHPKLLARLEQEIRKPNGMLLTTGPTGSGKTTTLYSFLREIHTPEIKIITIEDPVEYHLDGIVQTQVSGTQYTFAEGLRSIVRQDPDVIMVGEIRDGDTAGIAIQASLTGHFVFSTLHTNDAAGTFPRLVDLGADPKSFGSAITVSMAQRLLRRLDQKTKRERPLTSDEKKTIEKVLSTLADKSLIPEKIETVWEPVPDGEKTGYSGRIGVYEAIFMDDELARFLRDNPPENEIRTFAQKQGYPTMAQDGVLKALAGVTSLSEVAETVDLTA